MRVIRHWKTHDFSTGVVGLKVEGARPINCNYMADCVCVCVWQHAKVRRDDDDDGDSGTDHLD